MAIMQAALALKTQQPFWETPRNLVPIIGALAGVAAAAAGFVGFRLGQVPQPLPQTIVIQLAPGLAVVPAAPGR